MDKFDWKTTIRTNLLILRSVGLWPEGEFYECNRYLFYLILEAILLVLGFNFSQFISIFCLYSDLEALTGAILVTTTNMLALVKISIFISNLKRIKRLLTTLNSYDFRPKTVAELEAISPCLSLWKKIYAWYHVVVIFNLFMWSVGPAISGWKEHRLPFAGWFPFETTVSPNYEIAYLYQLACMWPLSMGNLNLDCICMALMMFTKAQCDLLCHNLKNLHQCDLFEEKLIDCIKHHKGILQFAAESNDFFSWIILGQFATSTAVTALIMFQLTLVSPVSGEGLSHLAYIHGITTQIFLYCWFGNEIEVKSSEISFAVYKSNWIGQTQNVQKTLLIFCIRCQKPIRITAIRLFSLSLQTFISIMRSAYSYFALLSNVNTR